MPLFLPLAYAALLAASAPVSTDSIHPNDHRTAAGTLKGGVLTLVLEARIGVWAPEGETGPQITTAAFGEPGRSLQTPGPLLRVPQGTEVRVTISNRLPAPLWAYGFGTTRGLHGDSVKIAPGASRTVTFTAGEPGTFYYAARSAAPALAQRFSDDSQLNGVIVVDPAGARPGADRIFAISGWFTIDTTTVSGLGPDATLAINGLSWPHTERLDAAVGDSLTWRVVNLSDLPHPMHLHGFYFRVDARGDGARDTVYPASDRRTAVTELVLPGKTMVMRWSPDRSGNWVFHCHLAGHVTRRALFEGDRRMPAAGAGHEAHDPMAHSMAALILGIRVAPSAGEIKPSYAGARPIRLVVRSRAEQYGDYVGYSYLLGGSADEADDAAMPVPGPLLELVRNEPVAVTIVNRTHEAAAVHWHGIELESFPDGVPGWSGDGTTTLPMIAPHDSLTVRFTAPRAGTFIYHSHSNEFQQIASGLYGALLVVDPAAPRAPGRDQVLLFSDAGPTVSFLTQPPPAFLNGRAEPTLLELTAGVPNRLRLINIRSEYIIRVRLTDGGAAVMWRPVAKDGADLPVSQATARVADVVLSPGETYDVEITPAAGAQLTVSHQLDGIDASRQTAVLRAK
jgi:FtsP/CotA-like multicopper oxidase with cupredoxin domain